LVSTRSFPAPPQRSLWSSALTSPFCCHAACAAVGTGGGTGGGGGTAVTQRPLIVALPGCVELASMSPVAASYVKYELKPSDEFGHRRVKPPAPWTELPH
jgi:hypothetical protein